MKRTCCSRDSLLPAATSSNHEMEKELTEKNNDQMRLNSYEFVCSFSIISLILYILQVIKKIIRMGLGCKSNPSLGSPLSWKSFRSRVFTPRAGISLDSQDEVAMEDSFCHHRKIGVDLDFGTSDSTSSESLAEEGIKLRRRQEVVYDNMGYKSNEQSLNDKRSGPYESSVILVQERPNCGANIHDEGDKVKLLCSNKVIRKKRPAKLVIPESGSRLKFGDEGGGGGKIQVVKRAFEVKGRDFCLASRRGKKEVMEDGYGIMTDIMGDPLQAFFGVYDGHGGCAAMEYAADNLGNNIVTALTNSGEYPLEQAIREGYLKTDKDFLCQDLSSGACAATVVMKDGDLYVAYVGDCRVVLCRNGVAQPLTSDHHVDREDERFRIESSGGYLNCRNGVWRVQGCLAVTRSIGDLHLKEWIIAEPEIQKIRLTSDCDFIIIASDGLWDKVTNQEAVEVVLQDDRNSIECCRKLVDIACSRGNNDDITVMVVDLQKFRENTNN